MKSSVKTGEEQITLHGKSIGFSLVDFWKWSVSDLVSNVTRGRLAEFIVASALGIDLKIARDEWQAYDLITTDGKKLEVKSAAYVQGWFQKRLSSIIFTTRATRHWDAETNVQSRESNRQADVYVFCHLKHKDKASINPSELEQWDFYVVSTQKLNKYSRSQVSITLKSLQKPTSPVSYDSLRQAISQA